MLVARVAPVAAQPSGSPSASIVGSAPPSNVILATDAPSVPPTVNLPTPSARPTATLPPAPTLRPTLPPAPTPAPTATR